MRHQQSARVKSQLVICCVTSGKQDTALRVCNSLVRKHGDGPVLLSGSRRGGRMASYGLLSGDVQAGHTQVHS